MFKKELFVPLWVTLALGFLLSPWLWDLAHAPDRSAGHWFLVGLASVAFIGFHVYWFVVRPMRRRRMYEELQGRGYLDRSSDDPQLASTIEALCPTPFAPTIRRAVARDDGRSRRHIVDGFTIYHRDFPQRENLLENWTYVLELRPLIGRGEIFVFSRTDRRVGAMQEMRDLSVGLSPAFLDRFCACSRNESGPPLPERLQEILLQPSEPAFLGTFCLKLTTHGWGFSTFPVLTSSWMARLLRFSDQLSDAIARP